MIFRHTFILGILIVAFACTASSAEAKSWPRVTGDTSNPYCVDAGRLAKATFQSTNAMLFWPVDPPHDLESRVTLSRSGNDISGGGGLTNQTEDFTQTSASDSQGNRLTIFWQQEPQRGLRLVAVDQGFNWEGDWYYLYALRPESTSDDLVKDFQTEDAAKQTFKQILRGSWNPPLVLTHDKTATTWFILMGEPFDILGAWQVYVLKDGAVQMPCTISFAPKMKSAVSLLPEAVRRLAVLLDSTLGSGDNEGTLHPTARIRLAVAEAWENATLRPWALVTKPYNDRSQVDAGLAQWAGVSVARGLIYHKIKQHMPLAEQALTQYYQTRFTLPLKIARQMGAYVTDLIYRYYYSFPGGDPNYSGEPANSPWPVGLR
jgi:hypothetical protein